MATLIQKARQIADLHISNKCESQLKSYLHWQAYGAGIVDGEPNREHKIKEFDNAYNYAVSQGWIMKKYNARGRVVIYT